MRASPLLQGIHILDLSRGGAAEACVALLERLGAEVERSNPTNAGHLQDPERSATRLDLVVTALRPSEARELKARPKDLLRLGATVVSITPYGLNGPYAERTDQDSACGALDDAVAASLCAAHAAVASLAALRLARRRAKAIWVEVATMEVLAACLGDLLPPAICAPLLVPPRRPSSIAVVPCADGYVGIAAPTLLARSSLATLTGVEAVRDPDADLAPFLHEWAGERTRDEIFHLLQLWRLPGVPVLAPDEVLREHVATRSAEKMRRLSDPPFARVTPFRWGEPQDPSSYLLRRAPRAHAFGENGEQEATGAISASRSRLLTGVRVLDLGMMWAGPYAGRLLAGLGAEIFKLEGPSHADGTRPQPGARCQELFADLNRAKQSLAIDLSSDDGREAFLDLAAQSDVVIENFSPRVMRNFALTYQALAARNPALVMLSMPAFDSAGPWADYVAYGSGLELATGLGRSAPNGTPMSAAIPYLDYLTGTYGAVMVLAGLLHRDRDGFGCRLELPQRNVAYELLAATRASAATGQQASDRRHYPDVDPSEVVRDPHLQARQLFVGPDDAADSCYHLARLPWKLHGLPSRKEAAAPQLGADSRRILRRVLGWPDARITRLARAGVLKDGSRTA